MKSESTLTLHCDNSADAGRLEAILKGEHFQDPGLSLSIRCEGSKILIQMRAKDVVALRAAINSCLRNVQLLHTLDEVQ